MKRAMLLLAALACVGVLLGLPVASAATTSCTGLKGAVTVSGNLVAGLGCDLEGTHVTGDVSLAPSGSLVANGATIDGNLEIANNGGANQICGSTIGGNLLVHNNSGTTAIGASPPCGASTPGNFVGGNLDVHNNGPGQITVSSNVVAGKLDCHSDSPPATGDPTSNIVGGKAMGECASLALTGLAAVNVRCPARGCTGHAQDGDTSVDFTVPGGGQGGTLTIILTPASGGCGEEGPSPVDSTVTYNAPAGYGPANPIIVNVTYAGAVSTICKNSGPGTPFLQLFDCGEDNSPPCIASGPNYNEGNNTTQFTLEITSGEPGWNGY